MITLSATQGTDDCTTAGREEHRARHDRCLVDHGREQGMKVSTVDVFFLCFEYRIPPSSQKGKTVVVVGSLIRVGIKPQSQKGRSARMGLRSWNPIQKFEPQEP